MVTKPDERQDLWREALDNYCALADEVVVVNGGSTLAFNHNKTSKVKIVDLDWPEQWDWETLPEHLNFGLSHCTGDWVLKLDIDQLIHEKEFEKLKSILKRVPETTDLLSLTKLNFVAKMRYFAKNTHPILFRRKPDIGFGYINGLPKGDLCMPMRINPGEFLNGDQRVPIGEEIPAETTDCYYWNFSYTFKTEAVAKAHYHRMARAWKAFYKNDALGTDDEDIWNDFIRVTVSKFGRAKEAAEPHELPASIREAIINLKPEQKGYNIWNRI